MLIKADENSKTFFFPKFIVAVDYRRAIETFYLIINRTCFVKIGALTKNK